MNQDSKYEFIRLLKKISSYEYILRNKCPFSTDRIKGMHVEFPVYFYCASRAQRCARMQRKPGGQTGTIVEDNYEESDELSRMKRYIYDDITITYKIKLENKISI